MVDKPTQSMFGSTAASSGILDDSYRLAKWLKNADDFDLFYIIDIIDLATFCGLLATSLLLN